MAVLARTRGWFRTGIRIAARDVTVATAGRSALIIAPHAADETLSVGATIRHKIAAGSTVTLLLLTDGGHPSAAPGAAQAAAQGAAPVAAQAASRAEVCEAAARLGVDPATIRWLGLAPGTVQAHEAQVCAAIGDLLTRLRPAETYVTCVDDPLPDHAAAGRAARHAASLAGYTGELREYPAWLWTVWPLRRGAVLGSTAAALRRVLGRRAVAVRVGHQANPKFHALAAYASQLHRPRGMSVDAPWSGMVPRPVLAAAADHRELFFPVRLDQSRSGGMRPALPPAPTRDDVSGS